jgi:hypothetical protein
VTCHREKRGIVVQLSACIAADFGKSVTKIGGAFGRDLEAKNMAVEVWIAEILRLITRRMPSHQLLDLTNGSPPGNVEPRVFAFRRGDARQLACSRPTRRAIAKRLRERRQSLERFCHA